MLWMSQPIRVRGFREESPIWNDRMFSGLEIFCRGAKNMSFDMYLGRFDCNKNENNSKIYKISY